MNIQELHTKAILLTLLDIVKVLFGFCSVIATLYYASNHMLQFGILFVIIVIVVAVFNTYRDQVRRLKREAVPVIEQSMTYTITAGELMRVLASIPPETKVWIVDFGIRQITMCKGDVSLETDPFPRTGHDILWRHHP